jgi:hypothetical protein
MMMFFGKEHILISRRYPLHTASATTHCSSGITHEGFGPPLHVDTALPPFQALEPHARRYPPSMAGCNHMEMGGFRHIRTPRCQLTNVNSLDLSHLHDRESLEGSCGAKMEVLQWLVLHGKILTAVNLAIWGWPHDPNCKLCTIHLDTVQHLLLDCSFFSTVNEQIFAWNGSIGVASAPMGRGINRWWSETIVSLPNEKRRKAERIVCRT